MEKNYSTDSESMGERLKKVRLCTKQLVPKRCGRWGKKRRVSQRNIGKKVDYIGKKPKRTDGGSSNLITVEDSDKDETMPSVSAAEPKDLDNDLTMEELLVKKELRTKRKYDPPRNDVADVPEASKKHLMTMRIQRKRMRILRKEMILK